MNSGSRKRKHRSRRTSHPQSPPSSTLPSHSYEGSSSSYPRAPYDHSEIFLDESTIDNITSSTKPDPLHALYIQAYEADVVRGSHAAAQSLEVVEYTPITINPKIGSALIRWGGDTSIIGKRYGDTDGGSDEDDDMLPVATQDTETAIWVDRYDARLLLDNTLPNPKPKASTGTRVSQQPDSPTGGWSDLPSDTEDTFFFTPDETEDFRKEKRRRLLEQTREKRLKARMEEDHVEDEENQEEEDVWGGSDEEPDEPQQELMRRTATHLLSSPNAAQLEMRILANYGSDKRFSFLRGRWSRKWNLIKVKARERPEEEKNKEKDDESGRKLEEMKKSQAGLGLVIGYGSDDDDSEADNNIMEERGTISKAKDTMQHSLPAEPFDSTTAVEEAAKEARRKRAKEWAEKRREMKSMKI